MLTTYSNCHLSFVVSFHCHEVQSPFIKVHRNEDQHLFLTFTAILAILHGQPMGMQIAERGALAKSIWFLPWVVVCGSDSRFEAELKDKFKSLETLGKVTGIEKWDIELATSPVTTQKNCQWLTQLKRNELRAA